MLPTKKRLVVFHFRQFFKYLGNHSELKKSKPSKSFVVAKLSF